MSFCKIPCKAGGVVDACISSPLYILKEVEFAIDLLKFSTELFSDFDFKMSRLGFGFKQNASTVGSNSSNPSNKVFWNFCVNYVQYKPKETDKSLSLILQVSN